MISCSRTSQLAHPGAGAGAGSSPESPHALTRYCGMRVRRLPPDSYCTHTLTACMVWCWCTACSRWTYSHLGCQEAGVLVDEGGQGWGCLLLVGAMPQHHRSLHQALHIRPHVLIAQSAEACIACADLDRLCACHKLLRTSTNQWSDYLTPAPGVGLWRVVEGIQCRQSFA